MRLRGETEGITSMRIAHTPKSMSATPALEQSCLSRTKLFHYKSKVAQAVAFFYTQYTDMYTPPTAWPASESSSKRLNQSTFESKWLVLNTLIRILTVSDTSAPPSLPSAALSLLILWQWASCCVEVRNTHSFCTYMSRLSGRLVTWDLYHGRCVCFQTIWSKGTGFGVSAFEMKVVPSVTSCSSWVKKGITQLDMILGLHDNLPRSAVFICSVTPICAVAGELSGLCGQD